MRNETTRKKQKELTTSYNILLNSKKNWKAKQIDSKPNQCNKIDSDSDKGNVRKILQTFKFKLDHSRLHLATYENCRVREETSHEEWGKGHSTGGTLKVRTCVPLATKRNKEGSRPSAKTWLTNQCQIFSFCYCASRTSLDQINPLSRHVYVENRWTLSSRLWKRFKTYSCLCEIHALNQSITKSFYICLILVWKKPSHFSTPL